MIAWAARERVNDRNFKALSQFNRLYNSIVKLFRDVLLRVQRVTVRAKCANCQAAGLYRVFESF
ncbi:hypothetical protein D3C86_1939190 [compost metagenome]